MLHRMVSDGDALMKPPECSIEFILRRGILLYDAIRKFPHSDMSKRTLQSETA